MPISTLSSTVAACMLTWCPTVTLLPMTVLGEGACAAPWPPALSAVAAVRTTVPSWMLVLLPTVILPASPAVLEGIAWEGNNAFKPQRSKKKQKTRACSGQLRWSGLRASGKRHFASAAAAPRSTVRYHTEEPWPTLTSPTNEALGARKASLPSLGCRLNRLNSVRCR